MYFKIYRDANNQWRWTLYSANYQKIANSGEGYWNKADCQHGIDLVKSSYSAPVHEG
jgi:uncharacterized protein YegP (UPF0339 family)